MSSSPENKLLQLCKEYLICWGISWALLAVITKCCEFIGAIAGSAENRESLFLFGGYMAGILSAVVTIAILEFWSKP